MKRKNAMYCLIYRIRKKKIAIDTKHKTLFFEYNNEEAIRAMNDKSVVRLCKEFGFVSSLK